MRLYPNNRATRRRTPGGVAGRAGRWSSRHRAKAIVGWLLFVVLATQIHLPGAPGTQKLTATEQLDGESAAASRALDRAGFSRPAAEQVLVQVRSGNVTSAAGRSAIADTVRAVRATGRVHDVRSPLSAPGRTLVSRDGRSALVLFSMNGKLDDADERVAPVVNAVRRVASGHPGVRVEEIGAASAARALDRTLGKDFSRAEAISVPLTFGILLIAFGALVAAFVPLLLALTVVVAGGGLLAGASHAHHVDASASTVLLLVGLAVGVDYSLFYIRRAREERAAGRSAGSALDVAAATSGRSVLTSGLTVIAAMAGLFLTGQHTFIGMAQATVLVVAVAVLGSLTVLPAMLSLLGDRVDKGRIPWFGKWLQRRRASGASRLWTGTVDAVLARPRTSAALAAGLLATAAIPSFSLHTSVLSPSNEMPKDLPIVRTYERVQHAFPGGPMPAQVVLSAPDVTTAKVTAQIRALRTKALASGLMSDPVTVEVSPRRTAAMVQVPLAGDGQNSASTRALTALRDDVIPATVGRVAHVNVMGATARSVDFNHRLGSRAPAVFAFVLTLAFVLLLWSFRSLVIATTGIVLNLLSVAAAYGVLVAVFQWGWGKSLLGLSGTGAITSWLPLFLFVILFGLSMDYHVFSVSRIKEGHDNGLPTQRAIRDGIVHSAGVITSAALIMVFVFLTFATLHQTSMKQLGVGLAAAVLIDAMVVRTVLLPATMSILGRWNWYAPQRRKRTRSARTEPEPVTVKSA
jgi:uncharacterized membrane protein YdfJ with MMPL/SSD domain